MATFTLHSRLHGDQEFMVPVCDGDGYVHIWENGEWKQICEGGGRLGSTLRCESDVDALAATARRWWKQKLASDRAWS